MRGYLHKTSVNRAGKHSYEHAVMEFSLQFGANMGHFHLLLLLLPCMRVCIGAGILPPSNPARCAVSV